MTACADAEDLTGRFLIDSSRSEIYNRGRALRRCQAILNRQLPGAFDGRNMRSAVFVLNLAAG